MKLQQEVVDLINAGYPVVARKNVPSIDDSGIAVSIYAALPNKAKEPKIFWTLIWRSEPMSNVIVDGVLARVMKAYGIPLYKAKGRRLVCGTSEDNKHCRITEFVAKALRGEKYMTRYLPLNPGKVRSMPQLLLKDETFVKRVKKWAKI